MEEVESAKVTKKRTAASLGSKIMKRATARSRINEDEVMEVNLDDSNLIETLVKLKKSCGQCCKRIACLRLMV